ncbi:hypothetical protein ACA910_020504 [Epithemia clementina (nom. ined.)]
MGLICVSRKDSNCLACTTTIFAIYLALICFLCPESHAFSVTVPHQSLHIVSPTNYRRNDQVDVVVPLKSRHGNLPTHLYRIPTKVRLRSLPLLVGAETFTTAPLGSIYMTLLALQYALQPSLAKQYAPKTIVKGTFVLAQDLARVATSLACLWLTHSWSDAIRGWTWWACLSAAGLPALLYVLQNYCSLQAYQNLSPITFNVLNQTKTLSAAVCCFFLLGQRHSIQQIVALLVLLLAALVMESIIPIPFLNSKKETMQSEYLEERRMRWVAGVLPALVASMVSGLAGALTQKNLQVLHRNSLLLSLEMSVISAVFNLVNLLLPWTPEGRQCRENKSVTVGWKATTWIPIATNAAGGILVGLVTKHAGAVKKGFALIQGMFLSGLVQNKFSKIDKPVSGSQWIGGVLAALSFTIFALFPVRQ